MLKKYKKYIILSILSLTLLLSASQHVLAIGEYTPLVSLPGVRTDADGRVGFQTYIPDIFRFSIGIATVMAFVMITFGGIVYATTDAMGKKEDGKKYVTDAIVGLLLVLGAWIILNTINPKILDFTLDIKQITTANSTPRQPASGTGCAGDCPYSHVVGNEVINYKDCFECVNAGGTGLNIKTKTVNGVQAQINRDIANKLATIQMNLKPTEYFKVTETWPPTTNHASQGQYDGTSVDVAMLSATPANVKKFISSAQTVGLRAVYEVRTASEQKKYVDAGIPACTSGSSSQNNGCVLVVERINAEHFSIYR